jgi:hypothetical protein
MKTFGLFMTWLFILGGFLFTSTAFVLNIDITNALILVVLGLLMFIGSALTVLLTHIIHIIDAKD